MALLRRLARHAEGLADLVPRAALVACVLHEVVEQLVAEALHLVLQGGGGRDAIEGIGGVVALDDVDEVFQVEVHECQSVIDTRRASTPD